MLVKKKLVKLPKVENTKYYFNADLAQKKNGNFICNYSKQIKNYSVEENTPYFVVVRDDNNKIILEKHFNKDHKIKFYRQTEYNINKVTEYTVYVIDNEFKTQIIVYDDKNNIQTFRSFNKDKKLLAIKEFYSNERLKNYIKYDPEQHIIELEEKYKPNGEFVEQKYYSLVNKKQKIVKLIKYKQGSVDKIFKFIYDDSTGKKLKTEIYDKNEKLIE